MSATQFTVYVPDRSAPFYFPQTLTPEEIRQALVSTGHTSVSSAEMVLSGSTITFRRPTGGTKGL
jgi:hypothetical protein